MNYWREDSWRASTFSTIRVTCTNCGMKFEYFGVPGVQEDVQARKADHEQECWVDLPLCDQVDKVTGANCTLKQGHPAGPQFDWFTDHNGHIWE